MKRVFFSVLILILSAGLAQTQELKERAQITPQTPRALANNEATYVKLRTIRVSQEVIPVAAFRMKREGAIFTFRSGSFYLLEPVNGKITGAVFVGDATLSVNPPTEVEQRYLSFLAKDHEFVEQFGEAVFRFTDGTEDEIRKGAAKDGVAAAGGDASGVLDGVKNQLRKKLKDNLDARLLEDVLSSQPGGKFITFIKGKRYGGKLVFDVDPHGVVSYQPDPPPIFTAGPRVQRSFSLAPEEVALMECDENHYGIWTSYHFVKEHADGTASSDEQNRPFRIDHQKLETAIAKNAKLDSRAETTVTALRDGLRVLSFDLFPTLRVDWVAGSKGEPLPFIQEGIEEDANFAVVLPRELKKGESYTIITKYGGKNAVSNEGNGNYYPITRDSWYPALGFGSYSTYDITLHVPKNMRMVATGKRVSSIDEGNETITQWVSEVPLAVAGFNFGLFKTEESQDLGKRYDIETDVNTLSPDGMPTNGFMGTGSTIPMMKKATAEAQVALDLYTNYFGEKPYKRMAMTQQTAFNYGQSWPGLVFLPISYFLDSTQRHSIGFGNEHGFFKVLGPHEIAHQWWGHMVGWNSYRDQWMSEGFAEMSASIFLQSVYTEHGLDDFHEFWAYQRKLLTDTNAERKRAIDVGPVTLGYRLATAKTGFDIPRDLIYPKGAYILHMLRFMMQDSKSKDVDATFREMMHDFTSTYANRYASTEDFKAIVEKHMTPGMDVQRNHKMDWFFNEYVYGTDYPAYKFEHSFTTDADGTTVLNFKLTQSHVSDNFVMLVPVYLEVEKGQTGRLGRIMMRGNNTVEQHVRLGSLKPKRAMIAYLDDVLGSVENK